MKIQYHLPNAEELKKKKPSIYNNMSKQRYIFGQSLKVTV